MPSVLCGPADSNLMKGNNTMTEKDIIKILLKEICWTQIMLAKNMGYNSQSAVGNRLRDTNGMRVDSLVKMLDVMGYELVIRSKSRQNKNQWIVDYEEDGDF